MQRRQKRDDVPYDGREGVEFGVEVGVVWLLKTGTQTVI
jgi:hypothetical protein